jgi:hypothetical protein
MAISRPVLLALLGVVLLGATALAVSNARTTADNDAAPAAVNTEEAPAQQAPAQASPTEKLQSALSFNNLESASVNARLTLSNARDTSRIQLRGAFERGAVNDVPKFALDVQLSLRGQRSRAGFVSLGEKAFFVRGDTGWRVPAEVWGLVTEAVGEGAGLPLQVDPSAWARDVKSEGTATVDGVDTEHLSAAAAPKAFIKDINRLTGTNSDTRGLTSASLDAWVGSDDRILRRLSVLVRFDDGGRIALGLRIANINEPQRIEAPARVLAGAPGGLLGQIANAAVRGATGGTSLEAFTSPNPGRAARAVRNHRKVVILFRNPRGLDDRAMAGVVRSADQRTNALVLTDPVAAVDRYGKLVEDLGVSQTPSIVIIDRRGNARLIEGFVDSDTLTQAVADAR